MGNLNEFVIGTKRNNINEIINNKDKIRSNLVNEVVEEYKDESKINILTLPSAIWNFERMLLNKFINLDKCPFVRITACERDRKLFSAAAMAIPARNSGLRYFYKEKYDCDVVTSKTARLYCTDIFNYVENTTNTFDFIWLDLISPLNVFIKKLIFIDKCTKSGSIFCITFLKARDAKKYSGQRQVIVTNILQSIGFEFLEEIQYFDTSPMIQLKYKKL